MSKPTLPTSFTNLLNINYPFVQAPMAGHSTVDMCAAVCNSGGLGSIAGARINGQTIIKQCNELKSKIGNKPFAINLFIPPNNPSPPTSLQHTAVTTILHKIMNELHIEPNDLSTVPAVPDYNQQIQAVLQICPAALTFTFGMLSADIVQQCKQLDIKVIGTATTAAEALYLAQHKCDAIVVQGCEAGGHRGSFLTDDLHIIEQSTIGLLSLLVQCKQVVPDYIPLIVAGGIGDSVTANSLFNAGADAICVGTLFLTTHESTIIPDVHKQLLLAPSNARKSNQSITAGQWNKINRPTCLTRVFSGKPARGIYNKIIHEFEPISNATLPWNIQSEAVQPLQKYAGSKLKNGEYIQAWAGQSYSMCEVKSSADVVNDIINGIYKLRQQTGNVKYESDTDC